MKTPEERWHDMFGKFGSAAVEQGIVHREGLLRELREAIAEMKEECAVTCDDVARGTNFEMAKYGANLSAKRIRALGETKATVEHAGSGGQDWPGAKQPDDFVIYHVLKWLIVR